MDRYSAKRSFSPSCSHSLHPCHSSHLRHPGYASHLHYFVTCVTSVTTVILVAFLSPLILPSFFAFATPYSSLSSQNLSPLSLLLPFTMSCLVLCWPFWGLSGPSWGHLGVKPHALDVLSVMARSSIQKSTITSNAAVNACEKGGE